MNGTNAEAPAGWSSDSSAAPVADPQLALGEFGPDGRDADYSQEVLGTVPRVLYGNTSRFGMVKGSIAARKATAAAIRAARAGASEHQHQESEGSNEIPAVLPARVPTTTIVGDAGRESRVSSDKSANIEKGPAEGDLVVPAVVNDDADLLGPMGSFKALPKVSPPTARKGGIQAVHEKSPLGYHLTPRIGGRLPLNRPSAAEKWTHPEVFAFWSDSVQGVLYLRYTE